MKRARLAALLVGTAFALGCGDSTGITLDALNGTWNATEFRFTNPANSSQSVELIGLGGSFSVTITVEGNFTTVMTVPGDPAETRSGTVSIGGDTLTIAESGQGSPTEYLATRDGSTLTLTTSDEDFDFDGDGTDDPALLRIVLQKQ